MHYQYPTPPGEKCGLRRAIENKQPLEFQPVLHCSYEITARLVHPGCYCDGGSIGIDSRIGISGDSVLPAGWPTRLVEPNR